jgi:hypothetical protein
MFEMQQPQFRGLEKVNLGETRITVHPVGGLWLNRILSMLSPSLSSALLLLRLSGGRLPIHTGHNRLRCHYQSFNSS